MNCAVHVSGFYLGKLRGLLGDGNNEPYDDYTLPSGKVCVLRHEAKAFQLFVVDCGFVSAATIYVSQSEYLLIFKGQRSIHSLTMGIG